jgi:hypothetical protein
VLLIRKHYKRKDASVGANEVLHVVVLRNSTNCTEIESSCLLAVFEQIIGSW